MHKKGKLDCTIYTVLRLRRRLTMVAEAGGGGATLRPRFTKRKTKNIPARRTIQGARARLDRQSAPNKYKRATGKHESSPHFDNVGGLTGQQIAESLKSRPTNALPYAKLLDNSLTENFFFTESIRRKPSRTQSR